MRPALALALLVVLSALAAADEGFFQVVERDGRSWLLDPEGRAFFSTGVNVFHTGADPAHFDPRRPEYSGLRFYRGFEAWCATAGERLSAWGFNTLGAWAEPRAVACTGLPYTVCLHLGQQVGAPWIDPTSPASQAAIQALIDREVRPRRDDRRLIGYFVDNELGWYESSLFRYWAREASRERLKQRLYSLLQARYAGDLAAFLADFAAEPRPRRFEDLAAPLREIAVKPGRRPRVIEEFVAGLADEYYRAVAAAVRAADPHHLLLGDRYAGSYSQAVARASARHMDVVSVNYAGTEPGGWVSPSFFDTLHRVTGKPLLVSEIYAAARENRSGNANRKGHYLVVETQRERAASVEGMASLFARLPYVVGFHWFQWSDQPTSGREDGEDFDMGLVDLQDRPYEEVTAAFARVNARTADLHREGPEPQGLALVDGAWSIPARSVAVDGRLGDWDLPRHWAPGAVAREPDLPFGDFYLAWRPEGLVVGLAYHDYALGAVRTPDPRGRKRLLLSLGRSGEPTTSVLVVVEGFDEREHGAPKPLASVGTPGRPRATDVRGAQRIRNLLTTAEVLVPSALFGGERLQAGQVVSLGLALTLEGDAKELKWPSQAPAALRLAPAGKEAPSQ